MREINNVHGLDFQKKKNILQNTEDNIHKTFIGMNFKERENISFIFYFAKLALQNIYKY